MWIGTGLIGREQPCGTHIQLTILMDFPPKVKSKRKIPCKFSGKRESGAENSVQRRKKMIYYEKIK
jgi:hypothetical protein